MENRNLNNSLFYGNIVKLESSKELLNDTLFFVDYVDDSKIKLISEKMETQVFYLNATGGIDNIDKIVVFNQQEEGYCVINRLLPGKLIKINFSDQDAFIQGEITRLENDMITVKTQENETLYIDFEYSGLLEKYNIRSIDIIKHYESYQTGEYVVVENEDIDLETDTMEEGGTMFSIEQQVNDYIEKSRFTEKNKKKVMAEIEKYKNLLEEYTELEEGIKIKKIANNQLLYSLFGLNPKIVSLFSSYLHKELYYNNEKVGNYEFDSMDTDISEWQYSVIEKNYNDIPKTFSEELTENNITIINTKLKDYHKKIRLDTNQNVAIVNKVLDAQDTPFFFAIGEEGEINVIPYDMVRVDKGEKIILNGLVFKNLISLHKEMNHHVSSNILSKTLQNLDSKYEKMAKIRMLTTDLMKEKKYFDEKRLTFYEFQKDKSFKEYIEELDFGLKEVYENIFDRKEVSIHQCLKKLSLFDMSKLNASEYLFLQKLVRENVNVTKRAVNDKRTHFIRLNKKTDNYSYVPHENMYEIIRNVYLSKELTNNSKSGSVDYQMGELLKIATIDNMETLLFELKLLNKENHIDFDDEEVDKYILDLNAKLNGEISGGDDENKVEYSKYYVKKQDMLRDVNKIVLKNVSKNENGEPEKYDPIQHLYENVVSKSKFNGTINEFVEELDKLLRAMHEENEMFAEFDNIFENEDDQEKIMTVLVGIIQEKQIRKNDKCYVEEEKKFYMYDGFKWVDADDFNHSLSKKKLLKVKNSIDEFEDIKTKIINDYVLQYIQKNEVKVDQEETSGEQKRAELKRKIRNLKYNKLRHLLKYNSQKLEYEKMFESMNFDELQYYSPYTSLLHIILGIDDLERKYSLIQRFIALFTIDNGDEKWFHCVQKNTKLMPKYLHKLSEAYLLYNNHDSAIKEICLSEGFLSENGDSWIHKESGFTIKKIDFDTNYGYDENGFKIVTDAVEGISDFEDEDDDKVEIKIIPKVKPQNKIKKDTLLLVKEITSIMMSDLHVKFKNIDSAGLIYTNIAELFEQSSRDPKYESLNLIGSIYVCLSMILVYVQCKNIFIDKPYSSCHLSFSGFPYQEDETALGGIEYVACYLHKRINKEKEKNVKSPKLSRVVAILFKKFSALEKSEEDIKNDLIYYIKQFLLKNDFVKDMISQKRDFENKNPNVNYVSKSPSMFKPSLVDITTKDDDEGGFSHSTKRNIDKYERDKRQIEMINMKIEEKIKSSIKKENPLLKTHYQEPFLVNFCCQDRDLTINSLLKSGNNKTELSKLVNQSNELFDSITFKTSKYLKNTTLNVPIMNQTEEEIEETRILNDSSIYSFLLEVLNLETPDKPIPEHLKDLAQKNNIQELGDEFYDEIREIGKKGNIKEKIQLLNKYGIEFSLSFMQNVISQHHRHQYALQEQYTKKENDKITKRENAKTKVLSDFQFEYIENIGDENLIDKFEKEREIMDNKFSNFMNTHLNNQNYRSSKNKFKTLLKDLKNGIYLEKSDNERFELHLKQLYNINYQLTSLVPGLLNNRQFHNEVAFKQFNYASTHIEELIAQSEVNRRRFEKIVDASEETLEIINNIANHKDILFLKTFTRKRGEQYSFLLYLFYKIMSQYIELNESTEVIIGVNVGIISMILEYANRTTYTYDKMVTNHRQSKQSEKAIKTEALRKLKPQEREAEKYKMAAKLGDWSYGNQSRVFKYYKQFYDEDTERANEIKNVARELYAETITSGQNNVYGNSDFENSLTEMINEEEAQNMNMVADEDGIVYDEQGCEVDDYE